MWDYSYQAGPVGALEPLSDYLKGVRIIPDRTATLLSKEARIPHRPGKDPNVVEFADSGSFVLTGQIRTTDAAGAVTHVNGEAGHIAENLSAVRRVFYATRAPHLLQRDLPLPATVQIPFRSRGIPTGDDGNHLEVKVNLDLVWPYWRTASAFPEVVNGSTNLPVGGDAPIADMILNFSGPGVFTHDDSGETVEILAGAPATIVDVGARTVVAASGGADMSNYLLASHDWWQYWEVADGAGVDVTSTVSVTATWRNQYQ